MNDISKLPKWAQEELNLLRSGIKRLSDEEELCAETTGDDPFSMVYLASKISDRESEINELSTLYSNAIARAEKAEELVAEYRDHSNPYWQDRAERAEEALRVERERCARIADDYCLIGHPKLSPGAEVNAWWSGQEYAASQIAKSIRTHNNPSVPRPSPIKEAAK